MSGPLAGVRVVDASAGVAGAVAAMYLADAGAEVVRLARVGGDRWADHPGMLCWNRNKIRADLSPADPAARRLLAATDVAVVDSGATALERAGLDARALRPAGSPLVHLWLPAGAPEGRWRDLPPDPWLQAAVTGAATVVDPPALQRSPVVAHQQGLLGAVGAVAALVGRERHGSGSSVVVSGLQAITALMSLTLVQGLQQPTVIGVFPHFRTYEDRDRRPFAFAALAPHFFFAALDALDLMELLILPGFDGAYERLTLPEIGTEVGARLQAHFATGTAEHWVDLLRSAGVPCSLVQSTEAWLDDETVAVAGMKVELDHERFGRVTMPGLPFRFSATALAPVAIERDAAVSELWLDGAAAPGGPAAAPDLPLRGMHVVEIGTFVVGTFGSMLLGSLGAEVVKVEAPTGDPYRAYGFSFHAVNRGKRGVILDLKRADDRAELRRLVRDADIVVENLRIGAAERLGLAGPDLLAENPGLVHTKISGWGDEGPMASLPAFDVLVAAVSGTLVDNTGVGQMHDLGTSTLAAFGTLAALMHRERTGGEGQRVATSMANHSLMCQIDAATRADGLTAPAPPPLEPTDGGWSVTTEAGTVGVQAWSAIWDEPWVLANDPWSTSEHPELGPCLSVKAFVTFDGVPAELAPTSPPLRS
jgi:crotonobetainyl-CoA:carnitine CoA-transferase CaiB-like acyl-CoA transferase